MKRPEMILFDYGDTLIQETHYKGVRGAQAVLDHAISNPHNITAQQIQDFTKELNKDQDRTDPESFKNYKFEIPNTSFNRYVYEYFDIKFDKSYEELSTIFWDAAAPAVLAPHIDELLAYLKENGIRSAVISNMSYSGAALSNRINTKLPFHNFEFIMSSCDYMYRKPHPRLFELALRKAHVTSDNAWYCGDKGYYDVVGANSVGMHSVLYSGCSKRADDMLEIEHTFINDWRELIALLETLK